MPRGHPPKRLSDVSHLFLSKGATGETPKDQLIEIVVWIAVLDPGLNRAHLASGVAAAFIRLGMRCTLLEFGEGLPNVGYYFSCKPEDYLIPTLDGDRLVTGWVDSNFRYVYSTGPCSVKLFRHGFAPSGSAHVIVVAFDYPFGKSDEDFFSNLNGCSARFSCTGDGTDRRPNGVIIFSDGDSVDICERFVHSFRSLNTGGIVFSAGLSRAAVRDDAVDQMIDVPAELRLSWSRRMPPSEPFFTDLDSSFLQFLSSHRRVGK